MRYYTIQSISSKFDQTILFLLRIGKILGHEISNQSEHINNGSLKKLYQREYALNGISIKGLKYLTFPRIEILDIIYAY